MTGLQLLPFLSYYLTPPEIRVKSQAHFRPEGLFTLLAITNLKGFLFKQNMVWKVPQNGFYLVRIFNYLNLDKEIYEPGKFLNSKTIRAVATWKMFVFGVFLVCIFLYSCIFWFTKTRTKKKTKILKLFT